MKITLTSIFVENQENALQFYIEKLGFAEKENVSVGAFKWLTVVSPGDEDGTELLLEPNDNPVARTYQEGIFKQGIPAASFSVDDVEKEYKHLASIGVVFTMKPTRTENAIVAVFNDTCGNLIQIVEKRMEDSA
ncbi:MAG: VOC family protein [Candidatus Kaiserbacteria bacterium]|nr:VOC family protein [Candidatus Kaiserbacteria bacterium]